MNNACWYEAVYTLLKLEISLHYKMTCTVYWERRTEGSLMLIFCEWKTRGNNKKKDTWWKQTNGNNRGSKHPSITRRATIITVCYTTHIPHTHFIICVQATRACVFISVYVCHRGERGKRPLPCTQIITWFYNVAYLYSGQFPLGGSQNNNAGHFTPPCRRPFSAPILSMDLSSFPR